MAIIIIHLITALQFMSNKVGLRTLSSPLRWRAFVFKNKTKQNKTKQNKNKTETDYVYLSAKLHPFIISIISSTWAITLNICLTDPSTYMLSDFHIMQPFITFFFLSKILRFAMLTNQNKQQLHMT